MMADSNSSVALKPVCLYPLSLDATVLVGDTMMVVVVSTVADEVTIGTVAGIVDAGTVVSRVSSTVAGKVTGGTVVSTVASAVAGRVASDMVPTVVAGAVLAVVGSTVGGGINSSSRDRLQWSVLTLMSAGMASLINLIACVALAFI